MTIDFFDPVCKQPTTETHFGIMDGSDQNPAFISVKPLDKWVAIVKNPNAISLDFHAIDSCIEINKKSGQQEKRCDAMLSYPENIIFIELKEIFHAQWIKPGIKQLKRTIEIFAENHGLDSIRRRRAFLANRRQPSFKYSHKEEMERFKVETSVRLIIHNEINV